MHSMHSPVGQSRIDTWDLNSHSVTMTTCLEHCAYSEDKNGSRLCAAVKSNHLGCVKHLISAGADVNECNDIGSTPIIIGAVKGNYNCVKLLIEAGADVNHVNHQIESTLGFAGYFGNAKLVKLLIEARADVNIRNQFD